MTYSEDHIALAAEYALGTLDAEERAQVDSMMSADKDFTAVVQAWENKLGVLNQMVGSVEPRPEVWEKIRTAAGLSEPQAPLVLPEAPLAPVAPEIMVAPSVEENANVIAFAKRARTWRNVATFATSIAAALVALLAVQSVRPGLLGFGSKPAVEVAEVKPAPTPAQPSAQYVALLQKDGDSPAFILTVDGATRNFTVRKIGAAATPDAGKSLELWIISDKLQRPRSLGVIGDGDFTARPLLASYDADAVKSATYALTVEQSGGSPSGQPTSTPVYVGKLIETVPSANSAH